MKQINLLTYESHVCTIDPVPLGLPAETELTAKITRKNTGNNVLAKVEARHPETDELLGEIDVAGADDESTQAKMNASIVIRAAITVEHRLNDIIAHYLFGTFTPNIKRDFFTNHILHTGQFTFAAKRVLVLEIVDELGFFGDFNQLEGQRRRDANKKKKKFEELLRKVMTYRNAFAHGDLEYKENSGFTLDYYSGGHRKFQLDDQFWTDLELDYAQVHQVLDRIDNYFS